MSANRLTVLGDSFSEGWGDSAPNGGTRGWVSRFSELMNLPKNTVSNFGLYGATTQHVVDKQLPRARYRRAPLVVAYAGVNDLLGNFDFFDAPRFKKNLQTIFDTLSGADTTVVTATYPDIPGNLLVSEGVRQTLRDRFLDASEIVEKIAADAGVAVIDLHRPAVWRDPGMWADDRLHPGPRGHQYFADEMYSLATFSHGLAAA